MLELFIIFSVRGNTNKHPRLNVDIYLKISTF